MKICYRLLKNFKNFFETLFYFTQRHNFRVSTKILNALDQIELSITKQCMVAAVHEEETKNNEELFVDIGKLKVET